MMDMDILDDLSSEDEESVAQDSGAQATPRRGRKPGRKAFKSDMKIKLERSRQSARECRARKKLRYQYLEDLAAGREKAVQALYREMEQYRQWALEMDAGRMPDGLLKMLEEDKKGKEEPQGEGSQ